MFFLSFCSSSFHFSSIIYSNSKEVQTIKLAHSREGQDYSKAFPGHTEIHSQICKTLKTLKCHLQFILPRQSSCFSPGFSAAPPPIPATPSVGYQRIREQRGGGWLIDGGDFRGSRKSLFLPVIKFMNHRLVTVIMARGNDKHLLADLTKLENP